MLQLQSSKDQVRPREAGVQHLPAGSGRMCLYAPTQASQPRQSPVSNFMRELQFPESY